MKLEELFKSVGKLPGLKISGYKYVGTHPNFNVVYFAKKYDENNIDMATLNVSGRYRFGIFPEYQLEAGSNFRTLDYFMVEYLKTRKEKTNAKKIRESVINSLCGKDKKLKEKYHSFYSGDIPVEIKGIKEVKDVEKDGFKVLYVRDNKGSIPNGGRTINIVTYKEDTAGDDIYCIFKSMELVKRKKVSEKGEYFVTVYQDLFVPTFLLK